MNKPEEDLNNLGMPWSSKKYNLCGGNYKLSEKEILENERMWQEENAKPYRINPRKCYE